MTEVDEIAVHKFRFLAEQARGPGWRGDLAARASVSDRTVRYWASGERHVPAGIMDELEATARLTPQWPLLRLAVRLETGVDPEKTVAAIQSLVLAVAGNDALAPAGRAAWMALLRWHVARIHANLDDADRPHTAELAIWSDRLFTANRAVRAAGYDPDVHDLMSIDPPIWYRWAVVEDAAPR